MCLRGHEGIEPKQPPFPMPTQAGRTIQQRPRARRIKRARKPLFPQGPAGGLKTVEILEFFHTLPEYHRLSKGTQLFWRSADNYTARWPGDDMTGTLFRPCFKTGAILVDHGSTRHPIAFADGQLFVDSMQDIRAPAVARARLHTHYGDFTLGYAGSNYRALLTVSVRDLARVEAAWDPHRFAHEVSTAEFFFSVTAPTVEGLKHLLGMGDTSYGELARRIHETLVVRYGADSLCYARQQLGTTPRTTGPRVPMNDHAPNLLSSPRVLLACDI